jgi:hypothetical protein
MPRTLADRGTIRNSASRGATEGLAVGTKKVVEEPGREGAFWALIKGVVVGAKNGRVGESANGERQGG